MPAGLEVAYQVTYRFVAEDRGDGFRAWETGRGSTTQTVDVAASCKSCAGGYRQQALNRFVAQTMIREKCSLLIVAGLWGCTIDLPRIADLMGVPTIFLPGSWQQPAREYVKEVREWMQDALARCIYIGEALTEAWAECSVEWLQPSRLISAEQLGSAIASLPTDGRAGHDFSYSTYEFLSRDHPLLYAMQEPDVIHFAGVERVLDIACGAGIFLDCLRQQGIDCVGVERDPVVAAYAQGMGLAVRNEDALGYLRSTQEKFGGIYCSHFVEHLPIDALQLLLDGLFACTAPGGVLVLVFPDPESIRSQLLGFWRDPEHVRFYHPELIGTLAATAGYTLEWSSYEEQPHEVVPFPVTPEALPDLPSIELPPEDYKSSGLWERILAMIGCQSMARAAASEARLNSWLGEVTSRLQQQQDYLEGLRERTELLWQVNNTWAWNDNVTLRLRRP